MSYYYRGREVTRERMEYLLRAQMLYKWSRATIAGEYDEQPEPEPVVQVPRKPREPKAPSMPLWTINRWSTRPHKSNHPSWSYTTSCTNCKAHGCGHCRGRGYRREPAYSVLP